MKAIIVAPAAMADIDQIWNYLATEVGDFETADRVRGEIRDAFGRLGASPGIGHFRPALAPQPVRFWKGGRFLVSYREEASAIHVFRVIYEARNIRTILSANDD